MSPGLLDVYMDGVMKEVKMRMGKRGVSFMEDGREWRLSGLFYADDFILSDKSEEELRVMVRQFAEVCRSKGLKINADKSKEMVLNIWGVF